ncbi:DUF4259 domain-containing protein [Actinocorallia sp. A-T 12471]|uniref:DUF4259 domain-containing protein n=1 Tax=Actinocorallia sp. A-T 12471 TaxID=3089813 RepID=UPI0029D0BF41|nr:DUF4259 domain-containing protein [Actinocorallia sp. A-T 12471]MDX6743266.1 DUF4259 domain-containing protein [Actinocorallia sp. A-T 12471]
MGSWDIGPFENDTGGDFAFILDDLPAEDRPAAIRTALEEGLATSLRDGGPDEEALAAAAIVASQCPDGPATHPIHGPQNPIPPLPDDLRPLAIQVLDQLIEHDSYLWQNWVLNGKADAWLAGIRQLRTAIASNQQDPNQQALSIDT